MEICKRKPVYILESYLNQQSLPPDVNGPSTAVRTVRWHRADTGHSLNLDVRWTSSPGAPLILWTVGYVNEKNTAGREAPERERQAAGQCLPWPWLENKWTMTVLLLLLRIASHTRAPFIISRNEVLYPAQGSSRFTLEGCSVKKTNTANYQQKN